MMYFPDQTWQTLSPDRAGIPASSLKKFLDRVENEPMNLHGLIILRDGFLVLEKYWEPFHNQSAEHVFSITKSVVSLLAGIAVGEGLIDEDAAVHSYFPEISPDPLDSNLAKLKLRHLMTMSSGQASDSDWKEEGAVKRFLSTPIPCEPGSRFAYMNGCATMVCAILQKVTDRPLAAYAQEKLFGPLQIERPEWKQNPDGICYGGYGISLKTSDIARIGLLLLNDGAWKGRQVVPRNYVRKATSALRPSFEQGDPNWTAGYGYFLWQNAPALGGYHGVGLHGHYCIVIPKYNLVCATTADGEMFRILHALEEEMIPNIS
ncbi:MAG TPA: serine hydrolase [Clostridia bacterium]|nr:serine hydrolase [Clostridia bacterium]